MFSSRRVFTALLCSSVTLPLTAALAADLQVTTAADDLLSTLRGISGEPQQLPAVGRETSSPESPQSPDTLQKGVVRFGDTLDSIADRNGLSLEQLLQLNPSLQDAPPIVGQQLRVHSSAEPRVHNLISLRPSASGGVSWPDTPDFPRSPSLRPIGNQRWLWPARGVFTSGYGWRWGRMHKGIDLANSVGTPIVAAQEGRVTFAGWSDGGYGYLVEITHPDGSRSLYAHQSRIHVQVGEDVRQGQQVGEMGSTGRSTGPHLHFEIHAPGYGAVNPVDFLQPAA